MGLSDRDVDRLRAGLAATTFAERFELIREAAAGGMGRVHDAVDRSSDQRVAIKVLRDAGPDAHVRFADEASTLERLAHPAIVAYVGHGITGTGEPYLAMAWLDGETLAHRLARSPALTIAQSVTIAARIADALVYAHAEGVVHRDLKPSNVLLVDCLPDRATVIDFGVAKTVGDARRLTHTGELLGTPGYMAPEQAMGRRDLDGRADLFALGCLLYECLAGTPAFAADEVVVVLAQLLLHDPPRLASLRPEVPARLDALIGALLAKDPARRLADPAVVAAELHTIGAALASGDSAVLAATPIIPAPAHDAVTRSGRGAGRRRALIAGGVVALVAAAVIVVASGRKAPPGAPAAMCTDRDYSGCEALCTAGRREACNSLGVALIYGRAGTPVDIDRGRALLDRGCRGGDGGACVSLARHLRVAGSPGEAIEVLERGCGIDHGPACEMLADVYAGVYRAGPGAGSGDRAAATHFYDRACSLGSGAGCVALAARLRDGIGVDRDPGRAASVLRASCDAGFAPACAATHAP